MDFLEGNIGDPSLLQDSSGYWYIVSHLRYPDVLLKGSDGVKIASKIKDRTGQKKIWWNSGPQLYVVSYAHSVEVVSEKTDQFWIKVDWKNHGGGIERTETVSDHVSCRDTARRQNWTFATSEEIFNAIKRTTAEPMGAPVWSPC